MAGCPRRSDKQTAWQLNLHPHARLSALPCPALPCLLQIHHDAKHPKLPWEPEKCSNTHELTGGVTTAGIAVRGSVKKK